MYCEMYQPTQASQRRSGEPVAKRKRKMTAQSAEHHKNGSQNVAKAAKADEFCYVLKIA